MKDELIKLGVAIKRARKAKAMTLKALADKAGVSVGLMSKIENFRTIPSLPVLVAIAAGLEVDLSALLEDIRGPEKKKYWVIRSADREKVEREDAKGVITERLATDVFSGVHFQSFLVTLKEGARRGKVSTDGDEFLFVLKGAFALELGKEKIALAAGDAIYFDGTVPHRPLNVGRGDAAFLVVYLIKSA